MEHDVVNIWRYGDSLKVVYHKVRGSGNQEPPKERDGQPEGRLRESISRAKATILELALCNPWSHFCTFTQDQAKRDRHDLDTFVADFAQYVRNANRARSPENRLRYLLVPERHKDGAWHLHGLLMGLNETDLKPNEHGYLDWTAYRSRFGFMSVSPVKDHTKCGIYMTKYVTKEMAVMSLASGKHFYYASQKLARKEAVVFNEYGPFCLNPEKEGWDFENDYVMIKWYHQPVENQHDSC